MLRFSFLFLFVAQVSSPVFAQSVDERVFERKSLKSIEKSIKKFSENGYIPMDVMVTPKGRKATFSARLEKPAAAFPWFAEFELTDKQFDSLYEENRAKQMRLVAHEQYTAMKKNYHACIWHFDPTMVVLTQAQLKNKDVTPEPQPLGIIWKPDSRIPSVGTLGGPYAAFEEEVLAYMKANQVPSVALAMAVQNRPVYEAYWGYADVDRKMQIQQGHAYGTAWFTRLITAVATLQLVEKGKLNLDQPVYPLLGIKPSKPATMDARTNNITVKQLLQQTAGYDHGITVDPTLSPRTVAKAMGLKQTVNAEQVIAYVISQPLAFEPGTKRVESAYGFFVLGRVIEKVSGMSYENYVLKNVAKPAGITSFTMRRTDPDKRSENSVIHYSHKGRFTSKLAGNDVGSWVLDDFGKYHFGLLDASYGWASSPIDMLAFGTALQANPSPLLSEKGKKVLIAMPDYQQMEPNADKLKRWDGMGLRISKSSLGVNFWMESRGTDSTNAVLCYPSGNMRCFMMNCDVTIGDVSTTSSFVPIASKFFDEARRIHLK